MKLTCLILVHCQLSYLLLNVLWIYVIRGEDKLYFVLLALYLEQLCIELALLVNHMYFSIYSVYVFIKLLQNIIIDVQYENNL